MPYHSLKIWKYLALLFKYTIVYFFTISVFQELISDTGTVEVFGYEMSRYYTGTSIRLSPYLFLSFAFIPLFKKNLSLKGNFYLQDMVFNLVLLIDAIAHVNSSFSLFSFNFGYAHSYYFSVWGLVGVDKVLHFLGGLALGFVGTDFLYRYFSIQEKERFKHPWKWNFFVGIGVFSFFFTLWEIFELFVDKFIGTRLITSRYDTNEDLLANTLGYLISFVLVWVVVKIHLKRSCQIKKIETNQRGLTNKTTSFYPLLKLNYSTPAHNSNTSQPS